MEFFICSRFTPGGAEGQVVVGELDDLLHEIYDGSKVDAKGNTIDHFTAYLPGDLPDRRTTDDEALTQCHMIVLDWDCPKTEWSWNENTIAWWETARRPEGYHAAYTTRHGVRFVYLLDEPVPARDFKQVYWGFFNNLDTGDYDRDLFDYRAAEWTRVYSLPAVVKENVPLWEEPWFEVSFPDETRPRLSPSFSASEAVPVSTSGIQRRDMPAYDEELLREPAEGRGRPRDTDWFKEAKRRLKGRECLPFVLRKSRPSEGERNSTLTAFVGQAVSLLFRVPETTPDHIFAMFHDPVIDLGSDEDWHETLWSLVRRFWAKEETKAIQEEREKAEIEENLLHGVREATTMENLEPQDLQKLLVVSTPKSSDFYILRPDGKYHPQPYDQKKLLTALEDYGHDRLYPTRVPSATGRLQPMTGQAIIDNYSSTIDDVKGVCMGKSDGAVLRGNTLYRPLYWFNPKTRPEYSKDADEWIRSWFIQNGWFDEETYNWFVCWVAWALAVDEGPICALSLLGPPSCGKQMLAKALAECFVNETFASGRCLVSRFTSELLHTPFLVVNEGLPSNRFSDRDPSDSFREFVTGDLGHIEQKFRDPIQVSTPIRILMTSNNLTILRGILGSRDLSIEDKRAICLRVRHLEISESAGPWLDAQGGRRWTKGWISGESGESTYVLANHFRYLYENRVALMKKAGIVRGSRLLMEGSVDDAVMSQVIRKSGVVPHIVESLVHIVKRRPTKTNGVSYVIKDGRFLVTTRGVAETYFRHVSDKRKELKLDQVESGLASFARKLPGGVQMIEGIESFWWEVDMKILVDEAAQQGHDVADLRTAANEISMNKLKELVRGESDPNAGGDL